ncbi:MAG: hypothetical protein JO353_06540 [Phycisphaerae bacterium]|nr:hypothetical protein [Phycisphaerae bacterium]
MSDLQSLCERGQEQLIGMEYLDAERTLVEAEQIALEERDFDALSRLYMPLQESRRQIRQRCGEGTIHLSLLASGPDDPSIDPDALIERYPQGQFLIAGWGTMEPAIRFRSLQQERSRYVETYLAAVYPVNGNRAVAIAPLPEAQLPPPTDRPIDALLSLLPPHSIVLPASELPTGPQRATPQTYAYTMDLWERLHRPFLSLAEPQPDSMRRIIAFRQTIRVDYACELAHQHLAQTAHRLVRSHRAASRRV